jgi:uncharacterized alkaline shock family protein YloU
MKIFYRVLLAVDAVILSGLSIIIMISVLKNEFFLNLSEYITKNLFKGNFTEFSIFIIAFIFFCVNLSFLLSGFRTSKEKRAIAKQTNFGEIKISLNTIENIVLLTSKKVNSIRDTKVRVDRKNDGVKVYIKAVVVPEIDIPLLAEDLQNKVKKSVEESTSIIVNDIEIVVENIYTGYRSRVE